MNSSDLKGATSSVYAVVAAQRDFPTCIHCEFFDQDAEICKRVNARPPARVIAQGCEAFDPGVPF